MSKVIDMTGQRFGKLTVLNRVENDKFGKAQWLCQCDCGRKKIINGSSLRKGLTVSCGCNAYQKMQEYNQSKVVDETGNVYGYLTVLDKSDQKNSDGRQQWICQCKCGNIIITTGKLLRSGHKISCGCAVRSSGEIKVASLLDKNNILFSEQYSIKINKVHYYFDFAIHNSLNNSILYLIEYDGEQHFNYKTYNNTWNTEENFIKTKQRDAIKNQWCKENNISLIRIPYTHLKDLCIEDLLLETSQFIINNS